MTLGTGQFQPLKAVGCRQAVCSNIIKINKLSVIY
jgi:hypothetical protein